MKVLYPWDKLKPGEGFFVPALDTAKARERGLVSAVRYRIRVVAVAGVKDGLTGVWFYRPRPAPSSPAES